MYSPLNSYAYIHWILDFKYILLLFILTDNDNGTIDFFYNCNKTLNMHMFVLTSCVMLYLLLNTVLSTLDVNHVMTIQVNKHFYSD